MIDDYDALIGLIYDGVMDDAPWSLALARVADFIGAVGVGLGMQDMRTHEFRSLGAAGISAELNPTYQRLAPDNRIWQEIARRREPLTDRMVMPKDALVRTELYADWFRPQDFHSVMAFPALFKDNASAVVVAFRSQTAGDFEAADLARLGRFAGHFGRALGPRMDREQTFERLAAANFLLDEVRDAILLIDREARPVHANAAARAMLDAGQAIRLCRGRPTPRPRGQCEFLHMAALRRDGEIRLAGRDALTLRLHACAEPLGLAGAGCLTVRITDPNRERERPTAARTPRPIGLDAPPGGSARRARDRGDGEGGGRDPRPRRADAPHPCPPRLREARSAQPRRPRGSPRPPRLRDGPDPKIICPMSSAQMTTRPLDLCFDTVAAISRLQCARGGEAGALGTRRLLPKRLSPRPLEDPKTLPVGIREEETMATVKAVWIDGSADWNTRRTGTPVSFPTTPIQK